MSVKRPVLRWHGGKFRMAPWIISQFPQHRIYVEPYGGAASVLLRKPRSYAEVYNDLDEDVVTLFRVLRDPAASQHLIEQLRLTPFSRTDFVNAYEIVSDPVERARRLIIRSFMGFGSDGHNAAAGKTGFRSDSKRRGTVPAHDWRDYPDCLVNIIERLQGVVIENRPALKVMQQHDSATTLHYVDPPYLPETRGGNAGGIPNCYAHEMTFEQHQELLNFLKTLRGSVVLSGYASSLYDHELKSWRRVTKQTFADRARPRVEVIWMNEAAASSHQTRLAL
jgi:DNA adenine methylase